MPRARQPSVLRVPPHGRNPAVSRPGSRDDESRDPSASPLTRSVACFAFTLSLSYRITAVVYRTGFGRKRKSSPLSPDGSRLNEEHASSHASCRARTATGLRRARASRLGSFIHASWSAARGADGLRVARATQPRFHFGRSGPKTAICEKKSRSAPSLSARSGLHSAMVGWLVGTDGRGLDVGWMEGRGDPPPHPWPFTKYCISGVTCSSSRL